ncbi:MAG: YfdX family protein [Citrobacter sp.]|uniref:YfdX family protein n=1 Tax=Citrobacter sp. TaxID=1896336 RepID=UPI002FC79D7D
MKKKLIVTAITLLAMSSVSAIADTKPSLSPIEKTQSQDKKEYMLAKHGFDAIRDVQLARLALFRGSPDAAENLIKRAQKSLSEDNSDWDKFIKKNKKTPLQGDNYIIIDESVNVSDDFIATPEKSKAIAKANLQLKNNARKEAIESLRLIGIDVSITQYLMPLNQTRKAVDKAQQLIKEEKYYEANLALKMATDEIITDTISRDET